MGPRFMGPQAGLITFLHRCYSNPSPDFPAMPPWIMNPKCMRMEHSRLRYPPFFHDLASVVVTSPLTEVLKRRSLWEPRFQLASPWHSLSLPPDGTAPLQKISLGPWVNDGNKGHARGPLEKPGPRRLGKQNRSYIRPV